MSREKQHDSLTKIWIYGRIYNTYRIIHRRKSKGELSRCELCKMNGGQSDKVIWLPVYAGDSLNPQIAPGAHKTRRLEQAAGAHKTRRLEQRPVPHKTRRLEQAPGAAQNPAPRNSARRPQTRRLETAPGAHKTRRLETAPGAHKTGASKQRPAPTNPAPRTAPGAHKTRRLEQHPAPTKPAPRTAPGAHKTQRCAPARPVPKRAGTTVEEN